jgi:hypothetical protein
VKSCLDHGRLSTGLVQPAQQRVLRDAMLERSAIRGTLTLATGGRRDLHDVLVT